MGYIIFLTLLAIGFTFGRMAIRHHVADLERREAAVRHMIISDLRTLPADADPAGCGAMVLGETVIATDYMMAFLASIKKIFGGELRGFDGMMQRARREAIVRMMEQAQAMGYDAVYNVRIQMADIGGSIGPAGIIMAQALAYGTAFRRKRT